MRSTGQLELSRGEMRSTRAPGRPDALRSLLPEERYLDLSLRGRLPQTGSDPGRGEDCHRKACGLGGALKQRPLRTEQDMASAERMFTSRRIAVAPGVRATV